MAPSNSGSAPVARKYRDSSRGSGADRYEQLTHVADPFAVVRHNMISQRDADKVWSECLDSWDLDSSSEEQRSELRGLLTQAFCTSSSIDEENLETYMVMSTGHVIRLKVIVDNMHLYCDSTNPSKLRIFVRCFEMGYFVVSQYNMLSDPANMELRQMLSMRIGEDPAMARYMFDTAEALAMTDIPLSPDEMRYINKFKAIRTTAAASSARSVGELAPRNDSSSSTSRAGVRSSANNTSTPMVPPPTSEARMGLAGAAHFR